MWKIGPKIEISEKLRGPSELVGGGDRKKKVGLFRPLAEKVEDGGDVLSSSGSENRRWREFLGLRSRKNEESPPTFNEDSIIFEVTRPASSVRSSEWSSGPEIELGFLAFWPEIQKMGFSFGFFVLRIQRSYIRVGSSKTRGSLSRKWDGTFGIFGPKVGSKIVLSDPWVRTYLSSPKHELLRARRDRVTRRVGVARQGEEGQTRGAQRSGPRA